jgi:hypothetical protein
MKISMNLPKRYVRTTVGSDSPETLRVDEALLQANCPYEGVDITGITGLTEAQEAALKALGAVEGS